MTTGFWATPLRGVVGVGSLIAVLAVPGSGMVGDAASAVADPPAAAPEPLASNVISLSFDLDLREPSGKQDSLVRRRVLVELVTGAAAGTDDGAVESLHSVQIDGAGALVSRTTWGRGADNVATLSRPDCRLTRPPLPSAPTVRAVIEDAVGPLGDPSRSGYRRVGADVFERDEGPAIVRISNARSLALRRIEIVDARTGQTLAVRSGFTIVRGRSLLPPGTKRLRCVPQR